MRQENHHATASDRDGAVCETETRDLHDTFPGCSCHRCMAHPAVADTDARREALLAELRCVATPTEALPTLYHYWRGGGALCDS